jgi:hypothetical protein
LFCIDVKFGLPLNDDLNRAYFRKKIAENRRKESNGKTERNIEDEIGETCSTNGVKVKR